MKRLRESEQKLATNTARARGIMEDTRVEGHLQ
jgi:hypothetical protein